VKTLHGLSRGDAREAPEPDVIAACRLTPTLAPRARERLALLAASIDVLDLPRWTRGALLTCARAGLAAGQDLGEALGLCADQSVGPVEVGRFEQRRDLVAFALSDELAAVRRELGGEGYATPHTRVCPARVTM
jgi:hypothetical protein